MTISIVQATQLSNQTVQVSWVSDLPPIGGFEIARIVGVDPAKIIGATSGEFLSFTDSTLEDAALGAVVIYTVEDLDGGGPIQSTPLTVADLELPFTYGPPRADADSPRYTSLATVRRRLRIPDGETGFDEDLTEAIVAAEIALDFELGRSLPDTGSNPQYTFVPRTVAMICTAAAIAVYKAADAPFGTAGSDEWFGAQSIADVAAQSIRRNPLIRGLQVSFGVG